ncbi:MAG: putative bifunctional diguanylate cyclase/phosphodiesterase [Ilumatobacteraceae bacterium]
MRRRRSAPGVLVLVVGLAAAVAAPVVVLASTSYLDTVEQLDAVDETERLIESADQWLHLSAALAGESASTSALLLSGRVAALQDIIDIDYATKVADARAETDRWTSGAGADELATELAGLRRRIDERGLSQSEAVVAMLELADRAEERSEQDITALMEYASEVHAGGELASLARSALGATELSARMSEALAMWAVVAFPPERPTLPQVSGLSHAIILLDDMIEDFEATLSPGSRLAAEWESVLADPQFQLAVGVMKSTRQQLLQSVVDESAFPDPSEITPQVIAELESFGDPFANFIDVESALFEMSLVATEVVEQANDDLRADAVAQRNRLVILLTVLVVVGVLAVVGAAMSIVRPLQRLSSVLRSATEGDLARRAEVVGTRELRTTAESFNQALDALERVEQKAIAIADERLDDDVIRTPTPGRLGASLDAAVERLATSLAEREDFRRRLAYESSHDALTMLPNRKAMFELARSAIARTERTGARIAVVHLDLDGFQAVNDQFGHHVGDRLLRTVAQRLSTTIRPGDVAARVGGDEFIVIAEPVSDRAEAVFCIDRLHAALSEPFEVDDTTLSIGASIGFALGGDDGLDAEDLVHRADLALYRAKERGRGEIVMCDDELLRMADERVELDASIVAGLTANEFELHYQPIVDAETGRTVALEALVRWIRPGHGTVSPAVFIPHAERSDLIIDIDRWVLGAAVAQARAWNGHPVLGSIPISVNFSGRHMSSGRLTDHVLTCLADADLEPRRVVVEMTESALVDDLETASREWSRLRAAGVRVALDDFGTGFMSLAVLRSLQADTLKIDQSFVARSDEPTERSLIQLMVQTGHLLGAVVVAEGVETTRQRDTLVDLGVERLQGYLFARPMPAVGIEAMHAGAAV